MKWKSIRTIKFSTRNPTNVVQLCHAIATNYRNVRSNILHVPDLNNVVANTLSMISTIDKVQEKNTYLNDVQRKYACTQDVND